MQIPFRERMTEEDMAIQQSIVASRIIFPAKHRIKQVQDTVRSEQEDTVMIPPILNQVMGARCTPYGTDEASWLESIGLDPEIPADIVGYAYKSGTGSGRSTSTSGTPNWKISLDEKGAMDIYATYYTLASYRSNFTLEFQDENGDKLGSLVHTKDSSTWSRGDYSTFKFLDANGNFIYDIGANYFAGNSYGNGAVYISLDLRDPSKIKILPHSYNSSSHYFYVDREFNVSHPFSEAKFVVLKSYYQYAYYRTSATTMRFSSYNAQWKIAGRV